MAYVPDYMVTHPGALQVLVQNSWCGMLSAVSTLLEASSDDSVTDSLLHICKVYIRAAGTANIELVREAFITALCKAAFPINYTIGILKAASTRLAPYRGDTSGKSGRVLVSKNISYWLQVWTEKTTRRPLPM